MNHLAHFALVLPDPIAGDGGEAREGRIVGALLGDFVKGPLRGEWPPAWEAGIRLHRRIDALSDSHPQRLAAARLLPPHYRRYAAILLDVYGDHLLSRHWPRLRRGPLPAFTADIYAVLARHLPQLPPPAAQMAQRLIEHDLLNRYGDTALIAAMLEHIGGRLSRSNPLPQAGLELAPLLPQLEPAFLAFYPALAAQIGEQVAPAPPAPLP